MKKFIYRYEAMSTPCELIFFTDSKSQADSIANTILLETKRLEKKYSYYKETSYLFEINQRKRVDIDSETKSILQRAKKYSKLTNGVYDITIATIKDLYRDIDDEVELEKQKQILLPFVGSKHFSLKHSKIIFDNPYTKIDLGGFVKEYSIDRAIMILKKNRIKSALVNYGGDIYVLGRKPNGTKFSIGIKDPQNMERFAYKIELENEALTTSASYERNYSVGSKKYSHILSTKEYLNQPKSVSVISKNCVESGVFSTALMINREIDCSYRTIFL